MIYSSAYIAVQLVLLWTHCKGILCHDEGIDIRKILLNVNIISIAIGLILFITRISLPTDVQDTLDMMGNMVGPLGMLLAGMVIADVPLRDVFADRRSYLSAALRLLVYPILALALMKLIQSFGSAADSKSILLTVYLASVTPACATITSMAQLYDKDAPYASSLYVLTTLLSIITMPIMVGLFESVM